MKEISLNIKDRVIQFAKKEESTVQSFFAKTGLKYGNFTGKSKKSDLGSRFIAEILLTYPNIDLHWLITGKKKIKDCQESQTLKVEEETEDCINYKDKYLKLLEQNIKLRDKVDELKEKKECNTIVTNTINK